MHFRVIHYGLVWQQMLGTIDVNFLGQVLLCIVVAIIAVAGALGWLYRKHWWGRWIGYVGLIILALVIILFSATALMKE
jgi:type IV secretory pathway VirB2 component (pilin)